MFGYPIFRPTQVFLQYCKNASAPAGAKVQNRKVQLKFKCRRNKGRSPVAAVSWSASSWKDVDTFPCCLCRLHCILQLHSERPGRCPFFGCALAFLQGGAATSPARLPATTEQLRSGSLPSNEGPWRLVVGSGSVSDNCWSPGAWKTEASHGCCFSLFKSYPAHPSSFGWKEAKIFHLSTGMVWNILEPWSHQGLVVIERTSLLHVTLPVVCKAGSIHRMLVALVLAFP